MEFFCGDYTMVESENKLGKTEEVFFTDIKEESWHSEFWFLMKNGDGHSAKVTSMTNGTSKSIDKSTLLDILTGEDDTYEVTEAKNLKTVTITTNFGAENEWVLKREYSYDNGEKELKITFDN